MNAMTKEQLAGVEIPDEKTGKMQTANKDIEWYKKELEAMRRIVHIMTQDRELLKKKLTTTQKHEEIKQIALRMLVETPIFCNETCEWKFGNVKEIWEDAEAFYKFAKEKEK